MRILHFTKNPDHTQHVESLARTVWPEGLTVARFELADAALDFLVAEDVDVVIFDFEAASSEILKRLREGIDVEIPIIALGGADTSGLEARALLSGASDFLDRDTLHENGLRVSINASITRAHMQRSLRDERRRVFESEQRFRQMADHLGGILWTRELPDGALSFVSRGAGALEGTVIGSGDLDAKWLQQISASYRSVWREALTAGLKSGEYEVEYPIQTSRGLRWVRETGYPIRDDADRLVRLVGITEDITREHSRTRQLRRRADRMDHLASHDPLTRVMNRRGLQRVFARELARRKTEDCALAAILIDLDDFKSLNDRFGQVGGDDILKQVARACLGALRPTDTLGRVGGDEFLVLLPDTNLVEGQQIAERLRESVIHRLEGPSDDECLVTASLGVIDISSECDDIREVLQEVQEGLALSKSAGKNRVTVVVSEDPMQTTVFRTLADFVGIHVVTQSIRDLVTHSRVGIELLVRGPDGALREAPAIFRASRRYHLLADTDLRCLEAAVGWINRHRPEERVHLKIFPSTLLGVEESRIMAILDRADRGSTLCLELVEQELDRDPRELLPRIETLREAGFEVGMTDAGVGRDSLESVIALAPDFLDLVRSFRGVGSAPERRHELDRVTRLATSLGIRPIAVGIENESDRAAAVAAGIRWGQGYLFDRPATIDALA
ncbi:MAG: diguanylate cyclase [Planctomycetes bacterium]|nr:diguanylate cyclase [Planctomycetota bacterium]